MTTFKTSETAAKKDVAKLQRAIVDGLEDVKAQDIQVFNTEHLSPLFERVIVASGTSNRQTKAIAASVRDKVKDAGFPKPRTEGEDNGEWIIVDCGAAVAHIMQPTIRQYYRLEELWGELPVRLKLGAAKPVAREAKVPVKTAARRAAKAAEAEGSTPAKKAPARKATASRSGGAQTSATTSSRTVPRTPLKTVVNTTTSSPARAPSVRSTAPASRAVTSKTAGTTGTAGLKTSVKADAKIAARAPMKTTAKTPAKTLSRAPAKAPASSATRTASKAPVKAAPVKTVVVKPRSVAAPVKRSAPAKRAAPTKSAPAKTPVRKAPGRKA